MFIKVAQRTWATENLSFVHLNGPALISFSRTEYFYCKCTGNICISGSLGLASQKWFCPMCLIWPSPWNCDAPITLLMKSCTQMKPPSSLNMLLLSLVTFSYLTMLERHYVINSRITSAKNPFGSHCASCQSQVYSWIQSPLLTRSDLQP